MRRTISRTLSTAILCLCANAAFAQQRWYIEAEDCEGLQRYPYHNEELKGWYAEESNCRAYQAPGRCYHASIHENAPPDRRTMTQKLDRPIPAGTYQVSLRTVGMGHSDRDTILRIHLGDVPVEFKWRQIKGSKKRFKWHPMQKVALKKRTGTVRFTAVQFGGNGHGCMYEPEHRPIWVDTLYVTADLNEKAPPAIAVERLLRAGVKPESVPPRTTYKADGQETPAPVGPVVDKPVLLASFDGRKNLWPNSSFELGMNDGWAPARNAHILTDGNLDPKGPAHGRYSLRIPARAEPFSGQVRLLEGGDFTLSMDVRGTPGTVLVWLKRTVEEGEPGYSRKKPSAKSALTLKAGVKEQWQRVSVAGKLEPGWYYLSIRNGGDLSVDGVQLERGALSDYAPRAELEGGLRTGQLGNIVYDEQDTLTAWFHNSGTAAKRARLLYDIVDMREVVVARGVTAPVSVPAGATVQKKLPLLPKLRGIFSVRYAIDGRDLPEGETIYCRMSKPSDKTTRHELGANIDFNPRTMALKKRLGLKWNLTCKTRALASAREGVHPKPDVWNWHDDLAALPAKVGMGVIPCFWPHRTTPFMDRKPFQRYRMVRGGYTKSPDLKIWGDYVGRVAGHYKDTVKYWCIDDETELAWAPDQLAEVVKVTSAAARRAAPGVKIGISAVPEFQEALLKHLSPDTLDFFGASSFFFHHWLGSRVRGISRRYGKRWVCYGVGGRPPMNTMYHTVYKYRPVRWKATWMGQMVVYLLLVQDVWIPGHYAGILRNDGVHIGLNKPLVDYDGTPLPWGATYGIMGTLLADAELLGDVPVGNTGLIAYLFRTGDRVGAVTWSTCTRDSDSWHLWKQARRRFENLTIRARAEEVEVVDMYWNALPGLKARKGALTFDLDEEPVFVLTRSLSPEQLTERLAAASVPASPVEVAVGMEGTALKVTVANRSDSPIRNAVVDLRSPENRPVSMAAAWIYGRPIVELGTVPAGGSRSVTVPTVLDGRTPFENGQVRATLSAEGGLQAAADEWLWMTPAPHPAQSPKIDGNLEEWRELKAAWLAYDWAWARFGREAIQIFDKGEHFSYPYYHLDARAAFWTAWDEENLYVAIRIEDDQPMLSSDPATSEKVDLRVNGVPVSIRSADGGKLVVAVGRDSRPYPASHKMTKTTLEIEAAVPWQALGGGRPALRPDTTIPFDVFWTDVDREEDKTVSATMRWAGGSTKDGYLLLCKP